MPLKAMPIRPHDSASSDAVGVSAGQHAHGRRLARTIGPQETEHLSLGDLQAQTVNSHVAVECFA
jgi:hypothetical protein